MNFRPNCHQRLHTKNDSNGHTRRVWLQYNDEGQIIAIFTDYYGKPKDVRGFRLPNIEVTVKEFNYYTKKFKLGITPTDNV